MIERTKKGIVEAFNRLIAVKEFDRISAADIAQEAEISKATFYRYFKDKYDVMNYNYKELLDSCLRLEECDNYRDLYYHLFYAARHNWQHLRRAFKSTGVNSFENYIYTYSMQIAENITKQNRSGQGYTPTERLQIDVFCYGISYMYKKWTCGQYEISCDEAADALYEMMPETLKHYWFVEGIDNAQ